MMLTLQPGVGATLPAQLLSLRLQVVSGAVMPELEAVAVGPDETERPITNLVRQPGLLVLAVAEPTLIRIRPPASAGHGAGDSGGVFPTGSVYGLLVGPEDADADRAALRSVDASGLRSCNLITMSPSGAEVVVTAIAQAVHVVLPPLAEAARVAARQQIGAPTVPSAEAASVRVVVDCSASLRPAVAAGWVAAMIEVISGLGTVVSSRPVLPVMACGQTPVLLSDHPYDQPAAAAVAEVAGLAPSIGFRSRLIPDGGSTGLTYVITDDRPTDLDPARDDLVHLVLLGQQALAPTGSVTVVDIDEAPSTLSADQIGALVASLLVGYRRLRTPRGPRP